MSFAPSDLLTVLLLVVLEGLLSADNAMVLAVLVLGLPRDQQQAALRYGIIGAFVFRTVATVLAVHMIQLSLVKLLGGAYLLWLPFQHFFLQGDAATRRTAPPARPWLGLTAFWATVVKVELTDIVFAIDSILVGVAMSPKLWVVLTGGILGIVAMRMVIGQLLVIVRRYPAIVDGAFVIILWVAIKLLAEWGHSYGWIDVVIPKWLSLSLIVVIFTVSLVYARRHGVVLDDDDLDDRAAQLITEDDR